MLKCTAAIHDALTQNIRSSYVNIEPIHSEFTDSCGYFTFFGVSKENNELHHIRAFNPHSSLAKQCPNKATTLFLQEFAHMSIAPDFVIPNSLEFYNNNICYSVKPTVKPITLNSSLNISRLLTRLLNDMKVLSKYGEADLSAARIFQIQRENEPYYFVQDWAQALSAAEEGKAEDKDAPVDSTQYNQRYNLYNLALSLLEVDREEKEALEIHTGKSREEIVQAILQRVEFFGKLKLMPRHKAIFEKILAKDSKNRLDVEGLHRELEQKNENEKENENLDLSCSVFSLPGPGLNDSNQTTSNNSGN